MRTFSSISPRLCLLVLYAGCIFPCSGCSLDAFKSPLRFSLPKPKSTDAGPQELGGSNPTDASIVRELSEFESFPFDINLGDIEGQPLQLDNYQGKVVIVDIWGTWCGPCRRVIPHLVKLQEKYPDDLQIVGLCNERTSDIRSATSQLTKAVHEFGINYPCALIDDHTIRKVPNFSGYPTMLFLDRTGKVRLSTVGIKPEEYFEALLSQLMAEPVQESEPSIRTAGR